MSDPIQSIARHLGIQTFGDGLLAKIGQTIDLLQEAARNRADLAAECERLRAPTPVCLCGLRTTLNPHPDAGKPEHFLKVGAVYVCIPCLNKANHGHCKEANKLRTERDAALAELAALKGGQLPVAMLRYARGVPGFENEMPHVVSCNDLPDGLYPVYLAPPAQASAWVPEGWKLVPERMHLDSSDIETIQAHCGDGQEDAGFGPYSDGVLWIGECEEEDGSKTYGLHIATADYPEEGSSTLVEFAAAPTPGASDGKGGDHSAHDLNMVRVPKDLHLITLGMLSSYVTTLAGIDFPDNDEGDHQQRLNETKRAAVNSAIAKLRALITGSTA